MHPEIKSVRVELKFDSGRQMDFYPHGADNEKRKKLQLVAEDVGKIQQVLAIKDKYRISDKALHELHMLDAIIPSKSKLQEEKRRLNNTVTIFTDPRPNVDLSTRRIADLLDFIIREKDNALLENEGSLLLRFSCDGAKFTKKINSVRGVFKILQPRNSLPDSEKQISMSPEDEHTLFLFLGDENRAVMEKYAKGTLQSMKCSNEEGLEVQGRRIRIEWILTCDWKALALLRGINAANSDYFCLWCYCTKKQICDFSIPSWPIQRSVQEQQEKQKSFGYVNPDLCSFIPYDNMATDDLHLRIRISLKLFNQVVTWTIDQNSEQKLEDELKRIGVIFHFWEERADDRSNNSVKKWSQPSGDDLKIIIKEMHIHNVLCNKDNRHRVPIEGLTMEQLREELTSKGLPHKGKKYQLVARLKEVIGDTTLIRKKSSRSRLQVSFECDSEDEPDTLDVDSLQQLWEDFDALMESLREVPSSAKYKDDKIFMKEARAWAQNFRRYTFDEDVTPYIHALVYHVPYFLKRFRYLHDIGVSQVERKNFDQRQAYYGCTNRNGGPNQQKVSLQILQRENRILWTQSQNIERQKRRYRRKEKSPEPHAHDR